MKKRDCYIEFTAYLKSESGEILARGEGVVNVAERFVTFTSDFVPLYHIGTSMEVVRVFKGLEVHRFFGKIYLSSKRLMRIVDIDDELLPGSEYCYSTDIEFPAVVQPNIVPIPIKKTFLKYGQEPQKIPTCFNVQILHLTPVEMTFQFSEGVRKVQSGFFKEIEWNPDVNLNIDYESCFVITTQSPLPSISFSIEVIEISHFGVQPSYLCKILRGAVDAEKILKSFLWEYNLQYNKLFLA